VLFQYGNIPTSNQVSKIRAPVHHGKTTRVTVPPSPYNHPSLHFMSHSSSSILYALNGNTVQIQHQQICIESTNTTHEGTVTYYEEKTVKIKVEVPNFKRGHVTRATPTLRAFYFLWLLLAMTHLHPKFEVSSFIHSKDMEGVLYTCKIDIAYAQYDVIKCW